MNGIGILGEARHGKDSVAAILVEEFDFVRRGFADALKEDLGIAILNWPNTGVDRVLARIYVNDHKDMPAMRTALQSFGQVQRALNEDYWIERLFDWADRNLRPGERLVIPDVRYRNEAEALRWRGFTLLRVVRPGFDNGLTPEQRAHASEAELRDYPADLTLWNRGTLDDLRAAVKHNIDLIACARH